MLLTTNGWFDARSAVLQFFELIEGWCRTVASSPIDEIIQLNSEGKNLTWGQKLVETS